MSHPVAAFGVTAASRSDHPRLAAVLEELGYAELWVNDTRRGDGLETLREAVAGSGALRFGVGVIALSDQAPDRIAARVRASGLPTERLTLGVGSGASASLDLVRAGVAGVRDRLPGVPIAVAAVGPRMAALAGGIGDAVVANWVLPERLAFIGDRVREGAAAAGRPAPRLVVYVRTAVGVGAAQRLRTEMHRYRGYGPHYARAFDAQGDEPIGVAVSSGDAQLVADALAPYRSLADTVVVRGLPSNDRVGAWLEIAAAARLSAAS